MRNIQEDENMATVYLCIGTQKTGTTSLQYFMRANEDVLKKQSYSYPYMELGMSDAFYKNRNAHFWFIIPVIWKKRDKKNRTLIGFWENWQKSMII